MKRLFLDSSCLLALEGEDDQHHDEALIHWQSLTRTGHLLATTSYVFDEVVTFLNGRRQHGKAVQIGDLLLASPLVSLIHVDEAMFDEAWRYFVRHADKTYSFTNCVSFVIMKRLRLQSVLTFDRHFAQAGFELRPRNGNGV